jgi:hypothetical protein
MTLAALHQRLRKLVLKTNAYWPSKQLSQWASDLAMRSYVWKFHSSPHIRRIYVRGGWNEDPWVPGLSDIDLALVIRSDLSLAEEYRFLLSFWNSHAQLSRFFPVFDVTLLDQFEFPRWLALSAMAPQRRSWVLLHGEQNNDLRADHSPRWRNRAVDFALWVYVDLMPPCLAIRDRFIGTCDLQRRVKKIFRVLRPFLATEEPDPWVSSNPAVLTANALRALDRAISQVTSDARQDAQGAPDAMLEVFPDKVFLVINDNLPPDISIDLVRSVYASCSASTLVPIVLNRRVLAYLVRCCEPYAYEFFRNARVLSGTNPLAAIAPPDREQIAAYLRSRVENVFVFARSPELFAEAPSWRNLKYQMTQAMALLFLLRDDCAWSTWQETDAHWRSLYPEWSRTFDGIKQSLVAGEVSSAREAFFHLFRPISREICEMLNRADAATAGVND